MRSYLLLEKADHLRPEGIERDTFPPSMVEVFVRRFSEKVFGYDHEYCLVFRNPA